MITARLRVGAEVRDALAAAGVEPAGPESGLVFGASDVGDDWEEVLVELREAYRLTQAAARAQAPVVYLVNAADLLGRRGAGKAMVACGLLSAARTAALEGLRAGVPCNVLAGEEGVDARTTVAWIVRLLEPDGPTGELIRLGAGHLGKALP